MDFREDVLKFADERKLDYPLLIGEEDGLAAVTAVGMTAAFPFTLFADSQQRIIALKVGELHHDEATLILDRVAAVDAGTLDLPTARAQISAGSRLPPRGLRKPRPPPENRQDLIRSRQASLCDLRRNSRQRREYKLNGAPGTEDNHMARLLLSTAPT